MSSSQAKEQTGGPHVTPELLPVDRGWAWLVMIGAASNSLFGYGFLRSLAIFFPEFLDKFQESTTMTTLAFGLNTAAFSVSAILVPVCFLSRYSARTVSLLGACLNAFCIMALAFAPSMAYVYVIFITIGAAGPMIFVSQFALLGVYFKKRLSLAVAIANVGVSLATMCAPVLTRYLLDEYSLQGALLIQGALSLHNIASCLLFRPPSLYRTTNTGPNYNPDTSDEIEYNAVENDPELLTKVADIEDNFENGLLLEGMKGTETDSIDDRIIPIVDPRKTKSLHDIHIYKPTSHYSCSHFMNGTQRHLPHKRAVAMSHNYLGPDTTLQLIERNFSRSSNLISSSELIDGNGIPSIFSNNHSNGPKVIVNVHKAELVSPLMTKSGHADKTKTLSELSNCNNNSSISVIKAKLKNSICCNPLYIFVILMSGLGIHTQCGAAYMPSLGKEQGLTDKQASLLMTVIGACDLCKLVYGYVADKGWIRRIRIVLGCQLVVGVTFQFASYFQSFTSMIIMSVIFGVNTEVVYCLLPGITVDLLGAEFIGQVISGFFVVNSVVISSTHVLFGALKDGTGSFLPGYYFLGGLMLLTVLLILMEPIFEACVSRDRKIEKEADFVVE